MVAAAIGMAATASSDSRSETTAVRRRPNQSTTVPDTRLATISGSAAAVATRPAAVALPVRSRASQGSATIATPLPTPETRVAASSSRKDRRWGLTDPGWQTARLFPR